MKFLGIAIIGILLAGGLMFVAKKDGADRSGGQQQTTASPSPSLDPVEATWEESQQTSSGTDVSSLEADVNGTVIQSEDFSDLQ